MSGVHLKTVTCGVCGGPQSISGTETSCPNCDWHNCDDPALMLHHDTRTCPECGHEW